MINALWIDDLPSDPNSDEFFTDEALIAGIDITNAVNVDSGMALIDNVNNHFDAIILDINCLRHNSDGEIPHQSALFYAISEIRTRNLEIPYFVYSALDADGIEIVESVIGELNPWDSRLIYHKPRDRKLLFEAIKEAVKNSEDYRIRRRYKDAFGIVSDAGLLDLLKDFEQDESGKRLSVIRKIRPLFEELATNLHNKGLVRLDEAKKIQDKDRSANIIKDCSSYIDLEDWRRKFIPTHIKRLFHFVSQCANESEHYYGSMDIKDEEVKNKLTNMLPAGQSPYLNRLMVFGFLEILTWVNRLPINDEQWKESWRRHFNDLAQEKVKTLHRQKKDKKF